MKIHKTHNLYVNTGSYIDSNGESKNKYMNVGSVMEGKYGPFIFLNKAFNPAGIETDEGMSDIIISMKSVSDETKDGNKPNVFKDIKDVDEIPF